MKLSLIIPTYNERDNIEDLICKLNKEFSENKIDGEIIIVDDNSPDGTGLIIEKLKIKYNNLKTIHRKGKLGLSSAVIDGFKISDGNILGVMDADLSHPYEKVHEMFGFIENGYDLVIGSRYIPGGKIKGWNLHRKILSKGATLLARIFTNVKDPMSGFFLVKKECFFSKEINSKGFKILLDLLVKAEQGKIKEVPIVFINRKKGKSKASIKEILYYLQNLFSYLRYKKIILIELLKFAVIGAAGTLINMVTLYFLTENLKLYYILSATVAFLIAVSFNFILNKTWTFREKIKINILGKYAKYFFVSLLALVFNIICLFVLTEFLKIYYLYSQLIAIGLSLIINYLGNKIWTFQNNSQE